MLKVKIPKDNFLYCLQDLCMPRGEILMKHLFDDMQIVLTFIVPHTAHYIIIAISATHCSKEIQIIVLYRYTGIYRIVDYKSL